MTERTLKNAFAVSAVLCVGLASALGYILWHRWTPAVTRTDEGPVVARGPEAQPGAIKPDDPAASVKSDEPMLSSIQLSPQRMQEIGVTTAVAEMKDVNDKLHSPRQRCDR